MTKDDLKKLVKWVWLPLLPWFLVWFGSFLNIAAVSANHGYMPVALSIQHPLDDYGDFLDHSHRVWQHEDHLKLFADWIQVPGFGESSIGDCFVWLGEWLGGPWWYLGIFVFGYGLRLYAPFDEYEAEFVGATLHKPKDHKRKTLL